MRPAARIHSQPTLCLYLLFRRRGCSRTRRGPPGTPAAKCACRRRWPGATGPGSRDDVDRAARVAHACARLYEQEEAQKAKTAHAQQDPDRARARARAVASLRRLGMVWAAGRAVPLSVAQVEVVLGYPPGHTDGAAATDSERMRWLRRAPSVHVLARLLAPIVAAAAAAGAGAESGSGPSSSASPGGNGTGGGNGSQGGSGLVVVALCSGLGGAAVALRRLGAPVRALVCVDAEPKARAVVRAWWERGGGAPAGLHQEWHDVREVTRARVRELVDRFGRVDLLVCGTLCKNVRCRKAEEEGGAEGGGGGGQGGEEEGEGGGEGNRDALSMLVEMNRVLRDVRDLCRVGHTATRWGVVAG